MKGLKEIWRQARWQVKTFFEGLAVVYTYEEDPELWGAPRKRARIRRRMARERRKHGKKADI